MKQQNLALISVVVKYIEVQGEEIKKGQKDRVRGMERVNSALAVCYLCSGVCLVLHAQFGLLMCLCQGSEGHPEWEHCSLFLSTFLSPFLCVCLCACL